MTRVTIVGSGYVGLVTGAGLADIGHEVFCVDQDPRRIEAISSGRVPFHEPGLEDLLSRNLGTRLFATTDLPSAVAASEVTFIAVGTPSRHDGSIDLGQVMAASEQIGTALRDSDGHHIVVVKSTVVPGTTAEEVIPILEDASGKTAGVDFGVAVNPEFLTEGTAVSDFQNPDRIVVGSNEPEVAEAVISLYGSLGDFPSIATSPGNAEMIKYASNTLLANLISFSNELANVAERIEGVDMAEVMQGVHGSRYLTVDGVPAPITSFLEAGCGFGGSCLPKDTKALIAKARAMKIETPVLTSIITTNEGRPDRMLSLLRGQFPNLEGLKVCVLGLAFKPDSDDVRESPAFPIIERLISEGADVVTHDPVVDVAAIPETIAENVTHSRDLRTALDGVDAVLLVTSWDIYKEVPGIVNGLARAPMVIDGRRLLPKHSVPTYGGIGL